MKGNCPICGKENPRATHYGDGCLKYALARAEAAEEKLRRQQELLASFLRDNIDKITEDLS